MATQEEIRTLAVALNALRPDWPTRSIHTYLEREHANRAYADLTVAAVAVAVDRETKTPRRLSEHGPWWEAAYTARPVEGTHDTTAARCTEPGHGSYLAHNCGACRANELANAAKASPRPAKPAGSQPPAEVVEMLTRARQTRKHPTPAPSEVPDDAA